MESADSYVWAVADGQRWPATENLVPGNTVYRERLVSKKGVQYRSWNPFRSKLAAAIMQGYEDIPIRAGSIVLYLGASTGTTVSHVSDIVGAGGTVFAVEHSSRSARDLLDRVAAHRPNVVPIIQDARSPGEYFSVYGRADVVYADIAQPDQTDIAVANCRAHLRDGGILLLVIKTQSIDATRPPAQVIREETERLEASFDVLDTVDLRPYDKHHAMVAARFRRQASS